MTMSPEATTALDLEGGSSDEMAEEVTASSVLLNGSTGLVEVSTSEADQTSSTSPSFRHHNSLLDIGFQSPLPSVERGGGGGSKSASEMPEISVGYSPQLSAVGGDDDFPPELADFSVGLSGGMVAGVSHIKSAEKTRRFPVPLSEGDVVGTIDMLATAVSQEKNGVKESLSFEADSHKEEKHAGEHESDGHVRGSPSDSEGEEDCEQASSSEAAHLSSAAIVRTNLSASDEPLQDILESKIAELEVACIGPSKVDEEEAKIAKAQKRLVKEVRTMLDRPDRSADDKLRLLNTKYLQQVGETRQLEKELLALRRKCEQVNKEKDTIYGEFTKVSALRQKLESLCRELQRQNKILLDENKRVSTEEQQKRQELSTKFHNTIKDITSKLEEQGDERLQQIKENEILREKLKHFTQQYEIREQHYGHQLRTKALEQQLAEVKLKQQQELFAQEEAKSHLYTEQIAQLLKTEQDLRSQLGLYGDKFEQFQDTLTKSNDVFATFKKEMEKMSKTIKKLEKENFSLKKKCEKSDVTIIELLDERASLKKQAETSRNQKEKLEALCRSLQAERKSAIAGTLPSQASLQAAMNFTEPQAEAQ
ncbi:hypothetical protein BDL97_08G008000 [Sphagnum fallax]|nr:hypothetical protein BDL97_08G008000 [Sphagnum fallax]